MNNKGIINIVFLLSILFNGIFLNSCKKFLSETPDKALVVPQSINDLQKLLDYRGMNFGFPVAPEIASDNYYITNEMWNSISSLDERNLYFWNGDNTVDQDWQKCYLRISTSNIVLEELKTKKYSHVPMKDLQIVRGAALFYRAYNFYFLSQEYSPPYQNDEHDSNYGIALKLSSDINAPTIRSTVNETYNKIITDLKSCIPLLPRKPKYKNRPSVGAVYGLLARTYLAMRIYDSCFRYADLCLGINSALMNYNDYDTLDKYPFNKYNKEVIFSSGPQSSAVNSVSHAKVDTCLYSLYDGNDLRKLLFYSENTDGTFRFKGSYFGNSGLYNGIYVDEIILDRAECNVRLGNIKNALIDLNYLLVNRWKTGTYSNYSDLPTDSCLMLILNERRKELAFRSGLRWFDLRRLNQNNETATTLIRNLNGIVYKLIPGDLRYTFLIPKSVINISGIEQNPR